MKITKDKYLKIILIWLFNSLVFIVPLSKMLYRNYSENAQFLEMVKNQSILRPLEVLIGAFLFNFIIFKIAKYISAKLGKGKANYITFFIFSYIELLLIALIFSRQATINVLITIYLIVVMIQDYLFSKLYDKFNILRYSILNAISITVLASILPLIIILRK